jgi:hypothetical protein
MPFRKSTSEEREKWTLSRVGEEGLLMRRDDFSWVVPITEKMVAHAKWLGELRRKASGTHQQNWDREGRRNKEPQDRVLTDYVGALSEVVLAEGFHLPWPTHVGHYTADDVGKRTNARYVRSRFMNLIHRVWEDPNAIYMAVVCDEEKKEGIVVGWRFGWEMRDYESQWVEHLSDETSLFWPLNLLRPVEDALQYDEGLRAGKTKEDAQAGTSQGEARGREESAAGAADGVHGRRALPLPIRGDDGAPVQRDRRALPHGGPPEGADDEQGSWFPTRPALAATDVQWSSSGPLQLRRESRRQAVHGGADDRQDVPRPVPVHRPEDT